MQTAFPQTEIGLLYLYCNNAKFERTLTSSEYIHTELIQRTLKKMNIQYKDLNN